MRKSLLSASLLAGLFILSVSATPALAAPEWGVTIEHHNAYGAQRAECPRGTEEYFPADPGSDCGVDPFTGSGTTFARDSGFNEYTVTIANVATIASGATLSCAHGTWGEAPTFSYQWLRDAAKIPGGTSNAYTLTAADQGGLIQCAVTGTNGGGATTATSVPLVIASTNAAPPPSATRAPEVSGESEADPIGATLACKPGAWTGAPTFSYHWLRNGLVIPGASSPEYTLSGDDEGAAVQCQVEASNALGTVVAENPYPILGEPEPGEYPPYVEVSPTIESAQSTTSPVTVVDELPSGLWFAGKESGDEASGVGWRCLVQNARTATCTRSDTLNGGSTYPPVKLHVQVGSDAPTGTPPVGGVTNVAVVEGGGVVPKTAYDATTVAAEVPFGIASFTTEVSDARGEPFTQASGHPFAATATLAFDSTPDDEGNLKTAGGSPKAIDTELPPGFVGNTQATAKCPNVTFESVYGEVPCPADSAVGYVRFSYDGGHIVDGVPNALANPEVVPLYNVEPTRGSAATFGFVGGLSYARLTLDARVRSGGNYGITLRSPYTPTPTVLGVSVTFCGAGATYTVVAGEVQTASCHPVAGSAAMGPLLTTPATCAGPALATTVRADTYQDPANIVSKTVYNGSKLVSGLPTSGESLLTGCAGLQFAPEVEYGPSSEGGTSQAGQPTGASFHLKVPQTSEAEKNATPELKDATVTLPEGMGADPSAAYGLEACTDMQFGLGSAVEPAEPATCPAASQVGTVKVVTPLLEAPLEGQVFIGAPECGAGGLCTSADAEHGQLFRLFLQVQLPERGVIVKLAGHVSANPTTGRLQATFTEQPQLPFSELVLTLKGGPRAPLANPQTCGPASTTADLTPWSAPGLGGLTGTEPIEGTPDATPSSAFTVDWDGKGGTCPTTLPFDPSFLAQTASSAAGEYSPLSVSFGRPQPASEPEEQDEQNPARVRLNMPVGLLGEIAGVEQCAGAQANAGTCPSTSEIGTATVGVGAGSHPYYLAGHVYLTGPYNGAPFGLAIAVPAEAGPFRLAGNTGTGLEVVRAGIAVDPRTAALTVTSDPLPQIVDGVPLRLHNVRVDISRSSFTFNPTSCAAGQQIVGSITGEPINQGEAPKTAPVASSFAVTGCAALPFHPSLTATTSGATSKANGASLRVLVAQKPGEANVAKVDVQLPKQLPARLTTLQKACLAATFESNPAACPAASTVGMAVVHTPLLSSELTGPVILVSHGGAAFPDLEVVLQGEGITLILDGGTEIHKGITYSRFETVPDAPISSFELSLPQGSDSVLATDLPASANSSFCGQNLVMPTTITGQNGKRVIQTTRITTGACTKVKTKVLTRAQKLAKALKACRTKYKAKSRKAERVKCEKQARKKYGPLHKAKKKAKKSSNRNGKAGR